VFGASFDRPEENLSFAAAQEFPFDLLSDTDKRVGQAYEVVRASDHAFAGYPERISYLIGPDGIIRRSYAVTDVAGHAAEVLSDLRRLAASE
jgi:thioredoxin-dependent peroxiredoxin